jgi:glycosyltransferase involved in cell wall biosynthesis
LKLVTNNLKISVITPSLNQGKYINDTINSVHNQSYSNFEHIIIDGQSKDGTIDILKSYKHLKWISDKDNGPANAINKGFRLADGDILTWINADDYYDADVFSFISEFFTEYKDVNFLSGNLTYIDEYRNILFKDKTYNFDYNYLISVSADVVRQPSTFFTKKILSEIGLLNESLRLVFDYDLFVRMLKIYKPFFIDRNFAFYRDYKNTLTRKHLRRQAFEIYKVSRKNGGKLFSNLNKQNLKKILFPGSFGIQSASN